MIVGVVVGLIFRVFRVLVLLLIWFGVFSDCNWLCVRMWLVSSLLLMVCIVFSIVVSLSFSGLGSVIIVWW